MIQTLTPVRFLRWSLLPDVEATRRAYQRVVSGGAEDCGCLTCRNFIAARELVYPPLVRDLAEQLGVDLAKEAEAYHMRQLRPGLHQYGGWLHLVGSLDEDASALRGPRTEQVEPGFEAGITQRTALVPRAFPVSRLLQLEFVVDLPWVTSELEPE